MRDELKAKRAAEVRSMFGRIVRRYDLLNRVLSLGRDVAWRRALAGRVEGARPRLAVDLCCGTGDVALALPPGTPTVAADFCLPMLLRARDKAAARSRRLPLLVADALALPLADGIADVVTVAFGVRNFERLEAGLAELHRVLHPGGRVLILEFSRPGGPFAPLLEWWARTVPPRLGRLLSGDREAYRYLPESVEAFPGGAAFGELLGRAGFVSVSWTPLTGGVATLYDGTRAGGTHPRHGGR